MTEQGKAAYREIKDALDTTVKPLRQTDYRDVLEELAAEIEGRLDGVSDELVEDE